MTVITRSLYKFSFVLIVITAGIAVLGNACAPASSQPPLVYSGNDLKTYRIDDHVTCYSIDQRTLSCVYRP